MWVRIPEEMATHSGILAWEVPWTEEPGRLQSMGYLTRREPRLDGSEWAWGAGGGSRIHPLQPVGPQPLASPSRCTIARCHRCPLRILSRQSQVPGSPPCASPQAPLPAPVPTRAAPPGAPAYLVAWLSVRRRSLVPLSSSAATSLGTPCSRSPRAHAGQLHLLGFKTAQLESY